VVYFKHREVQKHQHVSVRTGYHMGTSFMGPFKASNHT